MISRLLKFFRTRRSFPAGILTKEEEQALLSLERRLGIQFLDLRLLVQALCHTSYVNEREGFRLPDNERLEFLGDAVLDLAVTIWLMQEFPSAREGELSKHRSSLVNERVLARCAEQLQIGEAVLLGKGERSTGGAHKPSLLADTYEALLGALYLEQGYAAAESAILRHLAFAFALLRQGDLRSDYKTEVQEVVQERLGSLPEYRLVGQSGPDHQRVFEVEIWVKDQVYGRGIGRTKKEAEQQAARATLAQFRSSESTSV